MAAAPQHPPILVKRFRAVDAQTGDDVTQALIA
jgi:hypothetical protein